MESVEKNKIHIVEARPEDMEAVLAIRLRSRETDARYFPNSYEDESNKPLAERQQWFKNMFEQKGRFLILGKNGSEVVGLIAARETMHEPGTWLIHGVYVTPEFRGQKIADGMMRAILQVIQTRSEATAIRLDADATNERAIELYRKYGFEITETGKDMGGDGKEHDKVTMRRTVERE
jgi:ribosomal protein S18 acetylase RimI-like enzyme